MWKPFAKKKQEEHRSLQLITQRGMPFAYVEAYKALRTNISFLTSSQDVHAFVVTSTVPEEAKSNVSVNLALTLAASGKKVVLLDCDLRKPILRMLFCVAAVGCTVRTVCIAIAVTIGIGRRFKSLFNIVPC